MKITSIVAESNATGRLLVSFDNGAQVCATGEHLRDRTAFADTIRKAGLPPIDDAHLRQWETTIDQLLRTSRDGLSDRMDRSRLGPMLDDMTFR